MMDREEKIFGAMVALVAVATIVVFSVLRCRRSGGARATGGPKRRRGREDGGAITLLPPIAQAEAGLRSGCLTCGPQPVALAMDALIMVGFGWAGVTRDGVSVWDESPETNEDNCWKARDAEIAALADPDHDWRIVFSRALSNATYQRQGPGHWVLVERGMGFF